MTKKVYDEDSIEKYTGLQHVRIRPGMYIGATDEFGKHHLFNEVLDNSIDEYTSGTCNKIIVTLHNDESITVEDNGRGIPVGIKENGISAATMVVTDLQTGGKFNSKSYQNSGGMNGVGVAVTNAASEYFEMWIKREGKIHYQRFEYRDGEDGKPNPAVALAPLAVIGECPIEETGTKVHFKPDAKIFSHTKVDANGQTHTEYYKFNPDRIKERLEAAACLNENLEIIFIDETKPLAEDLGFNGIATIETENGYEKTTWQGLSIKNYLSSLRQNIVEEEIEEDTPQLDTSLIDGLEETEEPEPQSNKEDGAIDETFVIEDVVDVYNKNAQLGTVGVSVAFQWFKDNQAMIKSFVNNIPTPSQGTHVKGFEVAIQTSLRKYIDNVDNEKLKRDFSKVSNSDILEGLNAIVSIKISEPTFKSQTKEQLTDERGLNAVELVVEKHFTRILEENPAFSQEVSNRVLRAKRARELSDRARQEANTEKKLAKMSMPVKLIDCQSNDPTMRELFIVEGDSAAGTAKEARDKAYQAILPIRGKVLNVYGKTATEAFKNEEIKGMAAVFGCGTGEKTDLNKLRYQKIIVLTDADEDGKHIQTLLITMFYRFYPKLIQNGNIYIARPPLFSAKRKRSGSTPIYLRNYREYEAFIADKDESQWDIQRFKGLGEMNSEDLRDTTMSIQNSELYQLEWNQAEYENILDTFEIISDTDASNKKRTVILKEWIKNHETNVEHEEI